MNCWSRILVFSLGLLLAAGASTAGEMAKVPIDDAVVEPASFTICDMFDYATLFESESGPINEISLIGRYQGQYYDVEGDGSVSDWENRRMRAGVQVGFLDNFLFEGQFNLNPDEGRFVEDVEDLYLRWKPSDRFSLMIGKQKAPITREWTTSSKRIKTIERSALVNQVIPAKIGGVVAKYQLTDPLWVEGGIYSGELDEDWALPDFNGGFGASARIGYQLTDETELRFDYFYTDSAGEDLGVSDYDHTFSLNSQSDWNRFHLVTDAIYAAGINDAAQSDVFGVVIMPYYDVTDKLEAVIRYNYATSDSDNGIRLYSRYERLSSDLGARGDNYHSLYGGLNYYICGDKLKLMSGIQWATMDRPDAGSFDSWTYMAAVRLYF